MPRDRQSKADVAPLPYESVHALTLAADNDAHRLRQVETPRLHLPPHVEGGAPDPCTLDLGDRGWDAGDLRDSEKLARARAGLDRGGRQGRAAVLGQDRAIRAYHLGAAEDGAEILRVHDPVKRHEQGRAGSEQLLQRPNTPRLELGRHALVNPGGDGVKAVGRHDLDGREPGELVEAWIVAETRSLEHLDHLARARRLEHRVAAVN